MKRLLLLATVLLLLSDSAANGQFIVRHNRTRPCSPVRIPNYKYQSETESPTVQVRSLVALNSQPPQINVLPTGTLAITNSDSVATPQVASAKIGSAVAVPQGQGTVVPNPPNPTVVYQPIVTANVAAVPMLQQPQTRSKLLQWDQSPITVEHCQIADTAVQLYEDGTWVLSLRAFQNSTVAYDLRGLSLDRRQVEHVLRNRFAVQVRFLTGYEDTYPNPTGQFIGKPVIQQTSKKEFWVKNGHPENIRLTGKLQLPATGFDSIDHADLTFFFFR